MDQLAQLLTIYLTTPESDFYLSKMLGQSKDPSLEPLTSTNVSLGTIDVFGQRIAINLKTLTIKGLTNVQIEKEGGKPKITVDGDDVCFYADRPNTEAPPKGVPVNLEVQADLYMTISGKDSPVVPVKITAKSGTLIGWFTATGDSKAPDSVKIEFTKLKAETETTSKNISFDLSRLHSIFKDQIEAFVQEPSTLNDMLAELNNRMNSAETLSSVSQAGTQAAQAALKKLL